MTRSVLVGVIAHTFQGAEANIEKLARKHAGAFKHQRSRRDQKRIIIEIESIETHCVLNALHEEYKLTAQHSFATQP
jgi:hypothetical protein